MRWSVAKTVEIDGMELDCHDNRAKRGFILLIALIALAAGAKAILYDTLDPDLFWHLRVADQLSRQSFPGPLVDNLSFASMKTPWTPYSWLADLAMKALWDIGGYRAAIAATAILCGSLVMLIALIALEFSIERTGSARYLASAIAAFAGGFLGLPYLSFRPVTAALVLVALCVWLLVRDRRLEFRSRAVWLVIPLTVLLINVHLYAIFVPLAVAASLAERAAFRRNGILLLGTLAACLMTPMLPGVIRTAWHYQFTDVMVSSHVIAEMQPFYHGQMGFLAAAIAIFIALSAIGNRRAMNRFAWLWTIGGTIALLRMGRFAPVFAIFAAPTLGATLPRLSDRAMSRLPVQGILACMLIAISLKIALAFPSASQPLSGWINRMELDNSGYPAAAVDYLQSHVAPASHHVITEFTWGGYLEWRLGASWQVLLDGRTQVFPADFWRALYLSDEAQRKAYLSGVAADAAVVPAKNSQFRQSLLDLGWKTVYADKRSEVLVPPTEAVTSTPRSGQYTGVQDSASSEIP